jgi:hypothetical protein
MTTVSEQPTPQAVENREKRSVVVLQPGYLPWLGFFDQMRRSDVFVYYDDVQFDKHGWRNRNRIKTPRGPLWLTVPIRHAGVGPQRIVDTEIDTRTPWARRHTRTIRQYYAKAPFVRRYLPALEELLERPWTHIAELDIALAAVLAEWLSLKPTIYRASDLGIEGNKSQRLLNVCLHFCANCYLSGDAAQDYLDVDLFNRHNVAVEWQNYRHPTYPQLHGDFVPYLSIVDLLLNCGDSSSAVLRNEMCR